MHTRFLPIFFGVVFALTLFFAVAAGAQEERTDTERVGAQVAQVQQQQVPDNQQQILEAQQQQQAPNDQPQAVAAQQQVGVQSHQRCPGARHESTVTDPTKRRVTHPNITGGAVRITYQIFTEPTDEDDELFFELRDEDGGIVISETVDDATTEPKTVRVSTNPGEHEFEVEADAGVDYRVELEDCTNVEAQNDNNGGNGDGGNGDGGDGGDGGGGDGNPTNPTNPVTPTQDTTTPTTTDTITTGTTTTDTADPILEDTTANDALNPGDSVREADAFRCDFFLRVVRDENGFLRDQYLDGDREDELIVQRFEQCLSEDVLADTIPDRTLPFTGGIPLPFGGGLLLLVAAAVLAGRIIRR